MALDRELTATYIILGKSFIESDFYDVKGAFILLHSITVGLGDATPNFLDTASHIHMMAVIGNGALAAQTARWSMIRLISILETSLLSGVAA